MRCGRECLRVAEGIDADAEIADGLSPFVARIGHIYLRCRALFSGRAPGDGAPPTSQAAEKASSRRRRAPRLAPTVLISAGEVAASPLKR